MKMNNLKIRKCTVQDLRMLRSLSIQTFQDTYDSFNTAENMSIYIEKDLSCKQLSEELQDANSGFYFVELKHTPIGFLKVNFISNPEIDNRLKGLEIERIYVLKTFQDKGIGQFLLNEVYGIVRKMKLDYIWLGVWEHNLKARAFYKRNGFEEFGRQVFYLGMDKQNDLLVCKFTDPSQG